MGPFPRSVIIVTALLFVSTSLIHVDEAAWLVLTISVAGWGLVPWMVLNVLRDAGVRIRDLKDDEEWGYQDRPDVRPVRNV